MKKFYLRKNENITKLRYEEDKINNQIDDTSIHSLKRDNDNDINNSYYRNNRNYNYFLNNNKNYNKSKKNTNNKDKKQLYSNELTKILGKINKEFYKNKNKYKTSVIDCFNKDYLNLKSINNPSSKTNIETSKNVSPTCSQSSTINNPRQYRKKRKIKSLKNPINNSYNYNYNSNIGDDYFISNEIQNDSESKYKDNNYNYIIPIYQIYEPIPPNNLNIKLSNFILRNPHKQEIIYKSQNDEDRETDKKIRQVRKSVKKTSTSQDKFKRKFSPLYSNKGSEKNNIKNEKISSPKNINNIGNFYNFWVDNDWHTGGKINLSLNMRCRNNIDFYLSLYYIIKIQSVWRGYSFRKSLLRKSARTINLNFNIFHKQKLGLKTLFYILNKNIKKRSFPIFIEKINSIKKINKKKGYDLSSSLLNKISNCYQKYNKAKKVKNSFLFNTKNLNEGQNNNMKLNEKFINPEQLKTPRIIRCKTYLNYNTEENEKKLNIDYTNYKPVKTHVIYYKSQKKNKAKENDEENIKEEKRKLNVGKKINLREGLQKLNKNKSYKNAIKIVQNENNPKIFTIKYNDFNEIKQKKQNKQKEINNKINNNINIIRNKKSYIINNNNNNNENKNKLKKYKEYIYFLFLLFARIQKASNRGIFNELIAKLTEKRNNALKELKKKKLLRILINSQRKALYHFLKIYREKILIEKIKDKIINNTHKKPKIKYVINYKSKISNSENKIKNNEINTKHRQHNKKHIKIRKLNRATSVSQNLNKNNSYFFNNNNNYSYYSGLSKSSSISPKKMLIRHRTTAIKPKQKDLGEYYELTPEYLLKKKMEKIFNNIEKKDKKAYFKRWKNKTKKKMFLIYFIMLMKEYFCNDKSLKTNKEYTIGKYMFIWYRKTFN